MTDIDFSSKESITFIIMSICIVSFIGVYFIPNILSAGEDTGIPDIPLNNQSEDTDDIRGFSGSEVGIDGIVIQNNSQILTDRSVIVNSHISYMSGRSKQIISKRPTEANTVYKKFGDRLSVNREGDEIPIIYESEYNFRRVSVEGTNQSYIISTDFVNETTYNITDDIESILVNLDPVRLINTTSGVLMKLESNNLDNEFRNNYNTASATQAEAVINISRQGYIQSYEISLSDGGFTSVPNVYNFTISRVGGVELSEPSWVEEAKTSKLVANLTVNTEKSWIKLEHLNFRVAPKGSNIEILTSEGIIESEIPSAFEPGDTMYLVAENSRTWDVKISDTQPNQGNLEFNDAEFLVEISDNESVIYSESIVSNPP